MERLSMIRGALLRELGGNLARLSFLNTRLILSVGVDLNDTRATPDEEVRKAKAALETLNKMGFLKKEAARGA